MTRLRLLRGGGAKSPSAEEPTERDVDRALLQRVVDRDHVAHRAIYDRYHPGVYSFVCRRLNDPGFAEEITADVFYEIWRNAASYRGESPVSSWVFGIAHLKVLAARRFQAQPRRASVSVTPDETLQGFADPADQHDSLAARDELKRLLHAIDRLPEGQREVLRLAFLEDRSYAEIATELGISEANVKTRVNRARSRLRGLAQPASEG